MSNDTYGVHNRMMALDTFSCGEHAHGADAANVLEQPCRFVRLSPITSSALLAQPGAIHCSRPPMETHKFLVQRLRWSAEGLTNQWLQTSTELRVNITRTSSAYAMLARVAGTSTCEIEGVKSRSSAVKLM